jgi:hypothetical protein
VEFPSQKGKQIQIHPEIILNTIKKGVKFTPFLIPKQQFFNYLLTFSTIALKASG